MNDSMFKGWNFFKWLFNILIVLVTVYVLTLFLNLIFAIGYVIMLVIHEAGHVIAAKSYGASVHFGGFTPFGAYITITNETSVKENAIIAISGPLCGLLATVIYFILCYVTRSQNFLWLSFFTGVVSLMNLLPLNPFDGGKVISATFLYFPLIFIPVLGYGIYYFFQKQVWIAVVLALMIAYIIFDVIRMRNNNHMELMFQFSKSSKVLIFIAYFLILVVLAGMIAAMVFDYGTLLIPQIRPLQLPEDLIPYFIRNWLA